VRCVSPARDAPSCDSVGLLTGPESTSRQERCETMAGCPGRYRRASWCGSPNRGDAKAAGRGSCACRPLPLQLYPAGAAPVLGPDTEEAATTQPIGRRRFAVASYENRQQRDAPVSPTSRLAQSRSGASAGHTPSMPAPLIEFPADDRDRARRFWHGVLGITLAPPAHPGRIRMADRHPTACA
jgi:hypothetical protein